MVNNVLVTVWYFKESGKFYTEATICLQMIYEGQSVPMWQVSDHFKKLNQTGQLPGLTSGTWSGFILINCEEGYPCLITPKHLSEPEIPYQKLVCPTE